MPRRGVLTPFCANCGAEAAPGEPYCPRCGFRGTVPTKPELRAAGPSPAAPEGPPALTHLRVLSWRLILLAVYMGILAWSGLQTAFFPQPPSAPIYLVDMPAPLLAVNAALLLLPVCTLLFLGLGLMGLRAEIPEVRERLTWRLGPVVFGPLRLIGLLILLAVLAVVAGLALYALAHLGGGTVPAASLFLDAGFEALFVAFGWCLMVFPAKALAPWTTRNEGKLVTAASLLITVAAILEAGVWFVAAGVGAATAAADAGGAVAPTHPWADGLTALAAFLGLLLVAWVARRLVHRMRGAAALASAVPG